MTGRGTTFARIAVRREGAPPSLWKRGVSRRHLVKTGVMSSAGLATAAVIGCGREEAARTTTPATQPKRGGVLAHRGPVNGPFRSGFDPHVMSGAENSVMSLWYQGLLRLDPNRLEIEPELGQRWEQPTSTEYVFTLAPNVKWHNKPPVNGRALTADDIVFSLNRIRTNEPRFIQRGLLAAVDKIEAMDRSTVRITTSIPDVTTLLNLADISMQILAREAVERFEKFTVPEHVVGTGAFMLTAHDDTSSLAARNPEYWKPDLPYLDRVELVHILSEQSLWAAFLAGKIQTTPVPGTEGKKALAEAGSKYVAGVAKGGITTMIWPNLRRRPFDDERVYRALKLLVDHQEAQSAWLDIWFGTGNSLTLPQVLEGWELPLEEYATKLEWKQPKDEAARQALALLSAAGFSRDTPLRFKQMGQSDNYYLPAVELMQAQWRRLSDGVVQAEIEGNDGATATAKAVRGEFDVYGPQGRVATYDPDQFLVQYYHSKAGNNYGKYSDPRLDQMIEEQRTLFDLQQRKAAVKEILRYIIDRSPYTNFGSFGFINAWAPNVRNFTPETGRPHMWQFERVWLDT